MKTHAFKLSALALATGIFLQGCTLDGDKGPQGEQGLQGPIGETGATGSAGADASTTIGLSLIARSVIEAEAAAEILQYHSTTQTVYATYTGENKVAMLPLVNVTSSELVNPLTADTLSPATFDIAATVDGKTIDGMQSIAISGNMLAVAVQTDVKTDNGYVLFYNNLENGTPEFVKAVEVGALPDMVTFTPDGSKLLAANEGEPNNDYSIDPAGSISVIEVTDGVPADIATTIVLNESNVGMSKAQLAQAGVLFPSPADGTVINGNTIVTSLEADLEPEYITTTNTTAYVTLQENNAVAILNLADNSVQVKPLGLKDWTGLHIDAIEDGDVSFGTYPGLMGAYMPDTITHFTWSNATFLVTANEGDAREYFFDVADEAECSAANGLDYDDKDGCLAWIDEYKIKDVADVATIQAGSLLEAYADSTIDSLRVTIAAGDTDGNGELDTPVAYGARSFSIWDQNGNRVYDSGDDFERITAAIYGAEFNNTDDENANDDRSENKGPEPEAVTVGEIDGQTYAFVGLERMSGVMVYNVTNPFAVEFVDYINNRDTTEGLDVALAGDLAPESIVFVAAADSPTGKPLLLVGFEVSGSVSVYEINPK